MTNNKDAFKDDNINVHDSNVHNSSNNLISKMRKTTF